MAADVLSNLSGALAQTFAPELTRNWNRRATLAKSIPIVYGGGLGGAKNVAWDTEFSGATAASFAEGSDIAGAEFNQDVAVPATLSWGQYRSPFQLSNLEINAAAQAMGSATALEDILGERFIGATTKIISLINTDLFTGTGTDGSGNPNIVGLNAALAATGTYAGISKATYTEWAGNVSANGGVARALSMNILASAEQLAFVASGIEPGLIIGSAGIHTKYEGLFEAARRTVDSGQGEIPSYQGSTGRLYWRGKPFARDRSNPSQAMYMLCPDELELRVLPFATVPDGTQVMGKDLPSMNGKDSEPSGIQCHVYPLGRTGSGVKFVVEVYCQLKVKRPNAHVYITDISEV